MMEAAPRSEDGVEKFEDIHQISRSNGVRTQHSLANWGRQAMYENNVPGLAPDLLLLQPITMITLV
jgi:hypothetical protein